MCGSCIPRIAEELTRLGAVVTVALKVGNHEALAAT